MYDVHILYISVKINELESWVNESKIFVRPRIQLCKLSCSQNKKWCVT